MLVQYVFFKHARKAILSISCQYPPLPWLMAISQTSCESLIYITRGRHSSRPNIAVISWHALFFLTFRIPAQTVTYDSRAVLPWLEQFLFVVYITRFFFLSNNFHDEAQCHLTKQDRLLVQTCSFRFPDSAFIFVLKLHVYH